jgi:flagellar motor switch protein FliM
MTAARALEVFDARSPQRLSPSAGRLAARWARDAGEQSQDAWSSLGVQTRWAWDQAVVREERRMFERLNGPDAGGVFRLGTDRAPLVILGRARLMLTLVQLLLGAAPAAWPAERLPTALEQSLLAMLFEQLGRTWSQAWPGRAPTSCEFERPLQHIARARLFPPGETLAALTFQLHGGPEPEPLWCLTALADLERLAAAESPAQPAARGADIAEAALRAPLPLLVELGRVQLTVAEAERLRVGDVLVFDQSIQARLTARVSDRPKFRGRPGRHGQRLCFAIEEVLEEGV